MPSLEERARWVGDLLEFKQKPPWESEEYWFRTNPDDVVEVESDTRNNGSKTHKLLRKLEYKVGDEWKPYPVVVWIDHGMALYTGFFTVDDEGCIEGLRSAYGVPDGRVMANAKEKGILTACRG